MIIGLSGKVVASKEGRAHVDVNGVYFEVLVPRRYVRLLPKPGSGVILHTYLYHSREAAPELFGFLTEEELGFFELLLSVNGVGPKMALNILSASSPEKLSAAILQGRADIIEKAQGVGRKTAMRIALELKDKIKSVKKSAGLGLEEEGVDSEIESALGALGYKRSAIREALDKIDPKFVKLGDRLKDALKKIR